jgi:RNA polymerase sigma-70 factor (ECF subfamily)
MSTLATVVDPGTRGEAVPIVVDRDAALLVMLRRGDPHAPAQFVAQFGARAYRLAMGITRNAEDAEEAVQDAFLNVIRKIERFRGDSALRSWIYRIVANAAYQKRRTPASRHIHISIDDARPILDEDGRHGIGCRLVVDRGRSGAPEGASARVDGGAR